MTEELIDDVDTDIRSMPWGFHLILDCNGADHASITDAENVANFARQLVKDIDMVPYGEPQVVNFGNGDKEGFTLVQLIETSNICAHFCNSSDTFYLDVFSCKPFDPNKVILCVKQFFNVKEYKTGYIERKA